MSTAATTPNVSDNPFDIPLPSEVQEHQRASAATVASGGNPFDDPLPSEKAEASAVPPSKNFDVGAALGGMHGGSYDIAFRNPQGQISPDTIKAEAVGGSAGVAADAVPALLSAIGGHLTTIKSIIDLGAKLGAGTIGYKEARELYKEFNSEKKK